MQTYNTHMEIKCCNARYKVFMEVKIQVEDFWVVMQHYMVSQLRRHQFVSEYLTSCISI